MTRMTRLVAVLALTTGMVGCVYQPGGYDCRTGLMYGGALRPMCGGPLDPFCSWCDDCDDDGCCLSGLFRGSCLGGGCRGGSCLSGCDCMNGPYMCCEPADMCVPAPLVMPAQPGYPVTSWPAGSPSCSCDGGGMISSYPSAQPMMYGSPHMSYAEPQYQMAPPMPAPYQMLEQPQMTTPPMYPASDPQVMPAPGAIQTPPPAPPADMSHGGAPPYSLQPIYPQPAQPIQQASGQFLPPVVR